MYVTSDRRKVGLSTVKLCIHAQGIRLSEHSSEKGHHSLALTECIEWSPWVRERNICARKQMAESIHITNDIYIYGTVSAKMALRYIILKL